MTVTVGSTGITFNDSTTQTTAYLGATKVQTYSTAGTFTWTKPGFGRIAIVECIGGGGGGAMGNNNSYNAMGGGGGGYSYRIIQLSQLGAGAHAVSGLSVVRITTVNGTDTFDAGSINILYEG